MTEKIEINTDFITLQQLLKFSGMFDTCGMAKNVILNGLVLVNDNVCIKRGKKLYHGDKVTYNNKILIIYRT